MSGIKLFFTIITILSIIMSNSLFSQSENYLNLIRVSGEGVINVEPDKVSVMFGIVTRHENAEEARRLNDEASRTSLNAVRNLNVPEGKIRVDQLRLNELRELNRETRRMTPVGFEVVRQVTVELDDVDKLPALVARIVQQGANRLLGISYDVEDRTTVRNEALRRAVNDARAKAIVMTDELGVQLGKVVSISEEQFTRPIPIMGRAGLERAMVMDVAAEPEPEAYSPGEIEVRAKVVLTFELE